jgi:hypothetical protein
MDRGVVAVGLALVPEDAADLADHTGRNQSLPEPAIVGSEVVRVGVVALEEALAACSAGTKQQRRCSERFRAPTLLCGLSCYPSRPAWMTTTVTVASLTF